MPNFLEYHEVSFAQIPSENVVGYLCPSLLFVGCDGETRQNQASKVVEIEHRKP